MVCAPIRSILPSLKLGDYLSVQAHKPCSISHIKRNVLSGSIILVPISANRLFSLKQIKYDKRSTKSDTPKLTSGLICLTRINRIYYRSPMQTERSQPEGKRIMPETRFTEFSALSVYPRVGISSSASQTYV